MIRKTEDGLIINIKIVPNSSKNEVIQESEFTKVKITAQPIENKANKALIEFLSKNFKVPKTFIEIIKGQTTKEKTILIRVTEQKKQQEIISKIEGV